jgi:hypothetical protein
MSKKGEDPVTYSLRWGRGGWEVQIRFIDGGDGKCTVKSWFLHYGRPLTKREDELWREWLPWITALLVKHLSQATGKNKTVTRDMANWIDEYQSLNFGKSYSQEKRKAFLFLKNWRREHLLAQAAGQAFSDADQIELLRPVKHALDALNDKFLHGLTQSARILKRRYKQSDTVNRWLLEYKLGVGTNEEHTPEEICKLICKSGLRVSVKQLHNKLHKLGIPHKNNPRGKASADYGFKKGWDEVKARLTSE